MSSINDAEGNFILPSLATVNCQLGSSLEQEGIKTYYFISFVEFCGREEERGMIKKLIKEWIVFDWKNKSIDVECVVKLCIKINKVIF